MDGSERSNLVKSRELLIRAGSSAAPGGAISIVLDFIVLDCDTALLPGQCHFHSLLHNYFKKDQTL